MKINKEEFIKAWEKYGSPSIVAQKLGISCRHAGELKRKYGLETWNDTSTKREIKAEGKIELNIENGCVMVFSDAHYHPDFVTTMHRAFLTLIPLLKPIAIINNGDSFDGGTVSRYPRIGWDNKPSVKEELNVNIERLDEIYKAGKKAHCNTFIWNLGNHDARFETKLAASAPEFEGVKGFALKDFFPEWSPAWTTWINDETCITHYYHSGLHATHNNILKAQCHYVTGHTHSLQFRPWTDARGFTKWAVDTGTLAEALGPHNVDYQQGRHGNHRSGFAILQYRNGKLLMPELVMKHDDDTFEFRGHLFNADTAEAV